MGSQPNGNQQGVDPMTLAGLGGLGGATAFFGQNLPAGGVNPTVTGTVSPGLFQSSNTIGRNLPAGGANPQVTGSVSQGSLRPAPNQPVLMGQPQNYQGVPTTGTAPQFTGSAPGRLTPGTQVVPNTALANINQPPAVKPTGGLVTTPGTQMVSQGQPKGKLTASDFDYKVGSKPSPTGMGPAKQIASGLLKGGAISLLATPKTMADTTISGAFNNRVAAGEDPNAVRESLGLPSDYGNVLQELSGSELEKANAYAADYAANNAVVPAEQAGSENLGLFSTGGYFNSPTGQPSQVAQPTQLDIFNSRVAAGEDANQVRIDLGVDANFGREPFIPGPSVADVIIGKQARGPDATYAPEELNQITSIQGADQANSAQFVQDYQGTQMDIAKSLQDLGNVDDLRGVEAELAARGINRDLATPFQQAAESLAPANASSSFTPRSTFISDGKYIQEDEFGQRRELTPEQYNAFQSNMAELGQPTQTPRPMGRDDTRARLGGRTLSEYLNAPNGTEGVSGLRTDAQGRMIPGGYQTREQAYPEYEAAAAARNQGRQSGGGGVGAPQQPSDFSDLKTNENVPQDVRQIIDTPNNQRTPKERKRLAAWGGSTQGKEMGGVDGYKESNKTPQQKQEDELQNRYTQARLDKFEQEDPSAYDTAQSTVDDFIANGGGDEGKRSQYIAQMLGLAPKGKSKTGIDSFINGGAGGDLPVILTQEDFANLKSGDRYTDSQGNNATKP